MHYAELQITSNFSFLRGGSHPGELVEQAIDLGYTAIAITDRNSLAGIVRAHAAVKEHNSHDIPPNKKIQFITACRLDLLDGPSLLIYPTNTAAYSRLSALLTMGNLRAEKGQCHLYKADVYANAEGMKFIAIAPDALNAQFDFDASFKKDLQEYRTVFGENLYLAASRSYNGDDAKRLYRLANLGVPLVATNDVHYHNAERRELQDILTCIREKCTIHTAGFKLHQNTERHLKTIDEMHRLFFQYPEAIQNALDIAGACTFSLDELKYVYPEEITTEGRTPKKNSFIKHGKELTEYLKIGFLKK